MEISGINFVSSRSSGLETKAVLSAEPAGADAISRQRPEQRVEEPRESSAVELSALGQLQSSFAALQIAAQKLADPTQTPGNVELKEAASTFVAAFNKTNLAARQLSTENTVKKADVSAALEKGNATRTAELDLQRSLDIEVSTERNAINDRVEPERTAVPAALTAVGITSQSNGNLALNDRQFDTAVRNSPDATRSVLGRVAESVEQVSRQALAENSNASRPDYDLDKSERTPESLRADQIAQATAARQTVEARTEDLNNRSQGGAATYQRIFVS